MLDTLHYFPWFGFFFEDFLCHMENMGLEEKDLRAGEGNNKKV